MDQTNETNPLSEMTEVAGPVSSDRAQRFYDRIRANILKYLESKAHVPGKATEYLMLAPDIFMLLWRLVNDAAVNAKNKLLLGSGIAYFIFPVDMLPEAILGPVGFLDDIVFAVYLLNKMLSDTDIEVLRKHWSGSQDLLTTIQNILNSADSLVGSEIVARVKKMMK